MWKKGERFGLDKGEMIKPVRPVVEGSGWLEGPLEGTLKVENDTLFATIQDTKYELNASTIEELDEIVTKDPSIFLNSDEARKEDRRQDNPDDLRWLRDE